MDASKTQAHVRSEGYVRRQTSLLEKCSVRKRMTEDILAQLNKREVTALLPKRPSEQRTHTRVSFPVSGSLVQSMCRQ